MGFNSGLNMERSYYVATANAFTRPPCLDGEHEADVVVIGGGYTGLSAALNAARRGLSVIVLEAGRIGWGASGRNGGQLIPGWRKGAADLVKLYGEQHARVLFDLSLRARADAFDTISQNNIACDLAQSGHLLAAAKPDDVSWMRKEVETLQRVMDYQDARVLDPAEVSAKVASPTLHAGLFDARGGHFHPLNYALGLADVARAHGVQLFENSRALAVDTSRGVGVRTEAGAVRARYGVLACDALLEGLEPRIAGRIMPVANYLIATAPLEDPDALIAENLAVSDTRFVVNYFRLSADGRLIFGGGERYTPAPPADIAAFVRPFMLKVFPQLADTPIEYAWGGLVSISMTRMPHIGRFGDLFFAHGYSGQGTLLPAIAGAAISEAMQGETDLFNVLAGLAPPEFPGGAALRAPLHVLGMLWYALRDRL
ncbi:MAG: FAD-binding oxidoreductase [Hyphomonadaceae bacterium]